MARTIGRAGTPVSGWDPHFAEAWLDLLERLGAAIVDADVEGLERVRADLGEAITSLTGEEGEDGHWPVHGALLVNLRASGARPLTRRPQGSSRRVVARSQVRQGAKASA